MADFGDLLIGHTLRIGQRMIVSGLVILALSIVGSAAMAAPCDYETTYSCAVIAERSDDESVKALVLDTFVNSVVDVDDPTYLAAPVTGQYVWEYRPDLDRGESDCDVDTAGRF